jgi:energy-coupling factor transporter ATP-binding protein EcfA2
MTVLAFEHVWFGYGQHPVLRDTSFRLTAGEAVALVGRNGAGKTTITRLVMALEHPERGQVTLKGEDIANRGPEEIARHAAYVFQHPDQQLFGRTVGTEVAFGSRQLGRPPDDVESLVRESLRALGLEHRRDTHPYDLPPAERKLVTLAAALAQDPDVLVVDEPTQGLDRIQRNRVIAAMQAAAGRGVAVLAVTHDVIVVAEALDRTIALADGAIAYDGPSSILLRDGSLTESLGLEQPSTVRLAVALGMREVPVRLQNAAVALARHLEARG